MGGSPGRFPRRTPCPEEEQKGRAAVPPASTGHNPARALRYYLQR